MHMLNNSSEVVTCSIAVLGLGTSVSALSHFWASFLRRSCARAEVETKALNDDVGKKAGQKQTFRICTYNIRGYFDDYPRRKRLLRRTLQKVHPDVQCLQEVMVNGGAQDFFVTKCLNALVKPPLFYRCISDASILTYLRHCGAPPSYGKIVAFILMVIIEAQNVIVNIPFVGSILARLPRYLEFPRHYIYDFFGVDILKYYFILYAPIWGLSTILSPRLSCLEHESIPLDTFYKEHLATAHRTLIQFPTGHRAYVVNIHLDSTTAEHGREIRAAEVDLIIKWMKPALNRVDVVFAVGDNNTLLESEDIIDLWKDNGYVSAYELVHNTEPTKTWPSGISVGHFTDVDGNEGCLDYIWVYNSQNLKFHDAGVAGTESCEHDQNLFASDHYAIWTEFSFNDK